MTTTPHLIAYSLASILVLLSVGTPSPASGGQLSDFCRRQFQLLAPGPELSQLEQEMMNAERRAEQLAKDFKYVRSVGQSVQNDPGQNNSGIYRIITPDGEKVLKILRDGFDLDSLSSKYRITLQNFLSENGLAPRINGILSTHEVEKLIKTHPQLQQTKSHGAAMIMDEIKGAWSIHRSNRLPMEGPYWNEKAVLSQIESIISFIKKMGIVPYDAQLVISESGRVYIIDIEEFSWISRSGVELGPNWAGGQPSTNSRTLRRNLLTSTLFSFSEIINAYKLALKKRRAMLIHAK